MGKKKREIGVKRKRGKKFKWTSKEETSKPSVKSTSMFRDLRLGEKNPNLDNERKFLMRFQRERQRQSKKKQRFELDDEFELTHKGRSLKELEDDYFKDYEFEDSEEEIQPYKKPKLSDEITLNEHFGEPGKSRKKAYEELIQKSKYNKALKQQQKEEAFEAVKELDSNWEGFSQKLKFKKQKAQPDEYDMLIHEIREDNKVKADSHDTQKVSAAKLKEELENSGENWEVPESFQEFASKLGNSVLDNLGKMKLWHHKGTPDFRNYLKKLLEHTIDYLSSFWELESVFASQKTDELKLVFELAKDYPDTAIEKFLQNLEVMQEDLNLNFIVAYELVGQLFGSENDALSSGYRDLACYMLVNYPTHNLEATRNLLLLLHVHLKTWQKDRYYPETARCIQRVLKTLKPSGYQPTLVTQLFTELSSESLWCFTCNLYLQLQSKFKEHPGFYFIVQEVKAYLPESILTTPIITSSLQLLNTKPKELETFEPIILTKITSFKGNKDMNKETTQSSQLKQQVKKSQKATKRVLQKEATLEEQQKWKERQLSLQAKENEKKRVRSLLDQLQEEHKKLVTSQEAKKEKKKKQKRVAGNRF